MGIIGIVLIMILAVWLFMGSPRVYHQSIGRLRAENKELSGKNKCLSSDLDASNRLKVELLEKNERIDKHNTALMTDAQLIAEERDKLKKMVREQTNADMLIAAFKAVGIILDATPQDHRSSFQTLQALQQKAMGMQRQVTPILYPSGGLFGDAFGPGSRSLPF